MALIRGAHRFLYNLKDDATVPDRADEILDLHNWDSYGYWYDLAATKTGYMHDVGKNTLATSLAEKSSHWLYESFWHEIFKLAIAGQSGLDSVKIIIFDWARFNRITISRYEHECTTVPVELEVPNEYSVVYGTKKA